MPNEKHLADALEHLKRSAKLERDAARICLKLARDRQKSLHENAKTVGENPPKVKQTKKRNKSKVRLSVSSISNVILTAMEWLGY